MTSVGACYHLAMVRGSPNPLHFGLPARLRKTRKQSGLKRKALGHRVGRDPKVTAKVEAAERIPTVGTLARLAAALGVSAGWLGYGLGTQQSDGSVATTEGMGLRLASVRLERGLTKVELARRIDLSATAIANIEKGAQTGVDVLESLAKALGVSPAWLAFGEGPREIPKRRRTRTESSEPASAAR